MELKGIHCGGERGWMRVAYLNMNHPSSQCTIGFAAITANKKKFSVRSCTYGGSVAIMLQAFGMRYTQVCGGYVQEYAFGTQDAFDILTLIPMRLLVVTMLMVSL